MTRLSHAFCIITLAALCACAEQRHPLETYLDQLRPDTVTALPDLGWPAGTLLCPMSAYQSELGATESPAESVNAFLARKKFLGDEGHWSLIVVKPAPAGDAGIEHLIFKHVKNAYVINDPATLARDAAAVPAGFAMQTCVAVEQARVLVVPQQKSNRKLIVFGTQSMPGTAQ